MTSDPTGTHDLSVLADPSAWADGRSLHDRAAANRKALLRQLAELAEVIAAEGGPAAEGIEPGELARIRSAALHLAAVTDAALTYSAQP
jgi:hypothetical protein